MEQNNELCEQSRLAISSGEPLTDAQKKHIESCPECRTFQAEFEKLTSDLASLSVPGISDGQITDAVMSKIRSEKKLRFPKFKIQNHIGTAAALLIVIALFATSRGTQTLNAVSGSKSAEQSIETTDSVPEMAISNAPDSTEDSTAPSSVKSEFETGGMGGSASTESSTESNDEALKSRSIPDEDEENSGEQKNFTLSSPSSYGYTSSDTVKSKDDFTSEYSRENNYDLTEAGISIFEGTSFSNDFHENVKSANAKAKELFPDAEQLDCDMLINNGFTNEDFIEWAKTVHSASQYSFESLYEYNNR